MKTKSKSRYHATLYVLLILAWLTLFAQTNATAQEPNEPNEAEFTTDFNIESCKFIATGVNPYFILKPCYRLVLEGEDEGEEVRVQITVLPKTKMIRLNGIGNVHTRIVEEREWIDDELVEVSRNFFAICKRTNDVFYFGEEVDIFEDGEIVSHEGSWRAGVNGAMPGIIMPGTFLLGSRYHQEIAPGVAEDRAEHVAMGLTIDTPAGEFDNCVEIFETTPLDPNAESTKQYARGVGLVVDDVVRLVDFGFVPCGQRDKDKNKNKDKNKDKHHDD